MTTWIQSAASRELAAAAKARGETVLHVGRPLANALRGIDVDELAGATWAAAWARYVSLAHALSVHATRNGDASFSLLVRNVRWVHGLALGEESVSVTEAQIDLDAIEDSLRGVDVPEALTLVLAAARARLTLDAGKPIGIAPLAALAGVSLGTVRGAVLSGELKAPRGARGRVVRVRAKDAWAWLSSRDAMLKRGVP